MITSIPRSYKPAIVIFIVFIWFNTLRAQIPDYFANSPEWRMRYQIGWVGPCLMTTDYVLYVNGDTVINTDTYKKMYSRGTISYTDMQPNGCTDSYSTFNHLYALLKQEGRKIFKNNAGSDTLLYDFDLVIGDTLPITEINPFNNIVVAGIDSQLIDGSYRRTFDLTGNSGFDQLIEGIGQEPGYTGGLLDAFPPYFESAYQFVCFSINDSVYFDAGSFYCVFNLDIDNPDEWEVLKAFPNPANDWVILNGSTLGSISRILAYNS